jgi:putative membrane protein
MSAPGRRGGAVLFELEEGARPAGRPRAPAPERPDLTGRSDRAAPEHDAQGPHADAGGAPGFDPASAPPVPDPEEEPARPQGRAMQTAALLATRRGLPLGRWFWGLLGALIAFFASAAAWEAVARLAAASPLMGWAALTLLGLFVLVCLALALREAAALWRLGRIDELQRQAAAAGTVAEARAVADRLARFYAGRPDTRWGRERLAAHAAELMDADAILAVAERDLLAPLDDAAAREVEAAARQVALVTAVVPLAFADVAAALGANLRMIRRVAEIYGGRAGTLGGWRLARTVMAHLVATGAVAVGDDLIHSVAGGSVLTRLSRRFGEGLVNGALTARVGLAAMEVCRPLPFVVARPPSITALVGRALTGLMSRKD